MDDRNAVIMKWKQNRHDAMKRGMLKEVDRINKILQFYGQI